MSMPSDYIGYTGWEYGTGMDENRGMGTVNWNIQSGEAVRDTSFKYAGTASIRTYKYGAAGRIEFKYYPSWGLELYQSWWIYIDNISYWPGWWEFWSLREQSTLWNVLLRIDGSLSNPHWYFSIGWTYGGLRQDAKWYYDINQYGLVASKPWPGDIVNYNAHGIPRDRWFRLETYLYRHATNGIWKTWITDPNNPNPDRRAMRLLFSTENTITTTTDGPGPGESLQSIKQYGMAGTVYYDEFYVYTYNAHVQHPSYQVDTLLQKPDVAKMWSADTVLQKQFSQTYDADCVIGVPLGPRAQFNVDAILQKLDNQQSYSADAAFQKQFVETYALDTVLQKLPEAETYTVDTLLKKPTVHSTYYVSTTLGATGSYSRSYWADSVFSKADDETAYSCDTVFYKAPTAPTPAVDFLDRFKKIPTPRKMIVDDTPVLVDEGPEYRVDVFTTDWEQMEKRVEKQPSTSGTQAWKQLLAKLKRLKK